MPRASQAHQTASGAVDLDLKRADTGIHTVEGNIAGHRAAQLTKKREVQKQEYENAKKRIQTNARLASNIDERFNTSQLEFNTGRAGLASKEEFARSHLAQEAEVVERGPSAAAIAAEKKKAKREKKAKKRALAALSFGEEDGGAAEDFVPKKRMKNPNVKTDFLPDRQREEAEDQLREQLKEKWLEEQEKMKSEKLQVTYSYWDGSGHRRSITITKGMTVGKFLEAVRQDIAADFHELRTASSDSLLYIKEDLIIPQHYTFYDLIATKARGKSGPLFHFDVHDDVRVTNDARVEKDESHPGKIVERHWYERNKHIFPASRWEVYDPAVKRESYTIHGGEVN